MGHPELLEMYIPDRVFHCRKRSDGSFLSHCANPKLSIFFQDWMANINEEDEALKKLGGTKGMENDNLPPIRTAARSEKPPAEVCLNIVWNSLHMIRNDFYNTPQDMNILVRISYTWL